MNYELFVSLRYLRAKRKQTFISVISFISIIGITLGVAALIVVLAVMTGFHDGVRQQILGNIPHVLVQKYGDSLTDYAAVVAAAKAASPHVLNASPFVSKEAMLLSRRNVAAVNVKGIERQNKIFRQSFLTESGDDIEDLLYGTCGHAAGNSDRPGHCDDTGCCRW